MIQLGWSRPLKPVGWKTALQALLSQHVQIRRLLEEARNLADQALDGMAYTPDAVASSIGDIRITMEVHLEFEEGVLIPLLRLDGPEGHSRAAHMLDEHRQQRALMANLHREAVAHPHLPMLSAKLAFLATWLLSDMADEERRLTTDQL